MPRSLHDDRYSALVDSLIAARHKAGLTQAELAARLGRPQSYVAKAETLQRRLDTIELVDLVAAIGVRFRHEVEGWLVTISEK